MALSLRMKAAWAVAALLALTLVLSMFVQRQERVRLLVASNGTQYDRAAYLNFAQSPVANLDVDLQSLDKLDLRRLKRYDAVYLDPALKQSEALKQAVPALKAYVRQGGHLFAENDLLPDLPLDLLGASRVIKLPAIDNPAFSFPETAPNVRGVQEVFRLFAGNFKNHVDMQDMMPGFDWGYAPVPATAETVVAVNGQPICTINRYGKGTVFAASAFLPNRYFITGFDLQSGMDPAKGFSVKAERRNRAIDPKRTHYFDFKYGLPQEPYFHFAFAAANHLFRNEYVAFVSKETLGYSTKKVYGPYGRPAMAFQNHFEALPAFRDREAIRWAELLKTYNMIPSFSLVRAAFDWHRWTESIVVHLNVGSTEQPAFVGELPNSFYSSGTHLLSGEQLLHLAFYPGKVQLAEPIDLPYRAYPALVDLDGDGREDLLSGSADGYVYRFRNVGPQPSSQTVPQGLPLPDAFSPPEKLTLADGEPLRTDAYSTVSVADLNGDGLRDLLLGGEDGVVRVALQQSRGVFAAPEPLTTGGGIVRVASHSAPAAGDVDGDGATDVVVGDANGQLTLYRGVPGRSMRFRQAEPLFRINARYAAPALRDMDGDSRLDVVVGNSEGDLLVYIQRQDGWESRGPIVGKTTNQIGTQSLVGGHNSVPLWADLNHDGNDDLIVGQLEYSQPIPLDDPHFPYRDGLMELIDYAKENKLELYPHVYVHNYLSPEQEKTELELHRKTFAALGIPWTVTGSNQHTWRINNTDRLQTLRNENEADIWFNFGFKPSYAPSEPEYGPDYLWAFPFLLDDPQLKRPMLLDAPGMYLNTTVPGGPPTADIYDSFVQLDMPIDYFEHVEYQSESKLAYLEGFARYFDRLRTEHDYNFVSEPQMARSVLTAMTSDIRIGRSWLQYAIDRFKTKFGRGKHLTLTVEADTRGVPDLAGEYKNAVGVVFEPGEAYAGSPLGTDSPIFMKQHNRLYVGLWGKTSVSVSWAKEPMHVVRANVPIDIDKSDDGWSIGLNAGGMQQIKLYSPDPLSIEGADLKIEHDPEQRTYTVTHFGAKTRIIVRRAPGGS